MAEKVKDTSTIGTDFVVLVDEDDRVLGTMGKMEAHEKGLLHRAFSVLLYNDAGEMLIQKRAAGKYHTPGLWANACCSHPRAGEGVLDAASRRLREELGIEIPPDALRSGGSFIYRASFDNGLTEHEFDTMVIGRFNGDVIRFNPQEVDAVNWISMEALKALVKEKPERFTPWFMEILKRL
ncbi:isopentenyl-diphosphate Delta-isomerase [Acidaminobacter hydrogenoformans]|uniref:Isopentenyl-diphosphate delta-isomerase n=1 Tax=Acidaminobacter hydrogenoformans DSM 2784 TaxID=1120920 RepID=A0A1G5S592_9FIRM|nr:isopentenyl-diphosphate Delta-isomerase [Acidaminobacter hydrogenoformans]SCZ81503.1 isopentenyl-diphosphate delta-isomerase [Acidaminobacter hydrogenoformans DSM 2784]